MINRNNYEEYMLLYIDGELSSDERQAMDAFLQVNPDLKEELELLQQTILRPEQIAFTDKNTLYKKEEGINLSNYQEYFLLYVDNELDTDKRAAVETFVLKNPALQDEFTLLKETVLPNEWVIFQNKEVLYKKEEKRKPVVISLRWASLAAAVMIGIIAFVWILNNGDHAVNDKTVTADKLPTKPTKNTIIENQAEKSLPVASTENTTVVAEKENKDNNAPRSLQVKQVQQQTSTPEQVAVVTEQKLNKTKTEVPVIANNQNIGSPVAVTTPPSDHSSKPIVVSTPDVASNNYVKQAVYTEELNTDEEKNKNVYVGSLEINTDKVRGFFRKAGRFLSSKVKNKDEDGDKIQVANLQVNKLK
jgi:hypothetical protein